MEFTIYQITLFTINFKY